MKKTILTLAAAITFLTVSAQTNKGTIFIGGGLGTNGSNSQYENTNQINKSINRQFLFQPEIGFFIANKLALKLDLTLNNTRSQNDYQTTSGNLIQRDIQNSTSIGVATGLRYYIMLNEKFGFTGEFGLGLSKGTATNSSESYTSNTTINYGSKTSNFNIGIYPGIVYFPTPKIGLAATFGSINGGKYLLGLSSSTTTPDNDNYPKSSNTSFDFGLNTLKALNLSFNYYFAK